MFTTNSTVPNVWADAIKRGEKKIEDVPNLSNLVVIVTQIIEGDVENV